MAGHDHIQQTWRCGSCIARAHNVCAGIDEAYGIAGLETARVVRTYEVNDVVCPQGEIPPAVVIALDGWLLLESTLVDGRRAVIDVAPPGATLCVHLGQPAQALYGVVAATSVNVCMIGRVASACLREANDRFDQLIVDEAERSRLRLADRLLTVTTRGAREALARFLLEIFVRATRQFPPRENDRIPMPLTQSQLGESLGHTPVYINRLLRDLREAHIVTVRRGELIVLDSIAWVHIAGDIDAVLHAWGPQQHQTDAHSRRRGGAADGDTPTPRP